MGVLYRPKATCQYITPSLWYLSILFQALSPSSSREGYKSLHLFTSPVVILREPLLRCHFCRRVLHVYDAQSGKNLILLKVSLILSFLLFIECRLEHDVSKCSYLTCIMLNNEIFSNPQYDGCPFLYS